MRVQCTDKSIPIYKGDFQYNKTTVEESLHNQFLGELYLACDESHVVKAGKPLHECRSRLKNFGRFCPDAKPILVFNPQCKGGF